MIEQIQDLAVQLLTLEQWKAWAFLVLISIALTEVGKRVFFVAMPKVRRKQWIFGTAFTAGILAATAGFAMVGTEWTPNYYWAMFGLTAGPISFFLHWATLGIIAWKFPGLATALKGPR